MVKHIPRFHIIAIGILCVVLTATALVPAPEPAPAPERIVLALPDTDAPAIELPAAEQPVSAGLQSRDVGQAAPEALSLEENLPDVASEETLPDVDIEPAKTKAVDPFQHVTVESGDTLAGIFLRFGVGAAETYRITSADDDRQLSKIRPGQKLSMQVEDGKVLELRYQQTALNTWVFDGRGDTVTVSKEVKEPTIRYVQASGVVNGSLYLAGSRAGLTDRLTMNLAGIFEHVVNFALDIRPGDSFTVVYEEQYVDGEKIGNGNIVAADFVNRGERFTAFRYTDTKGDVGYYDADGTSMRKAFLLAPLNYKRISSNFNLRRKHPKLNTIRAHKGTDYAAPTGTPIYAAGDGVVKQAGVNGGFGKMVTLRHPGNIETRYAHMSRIAVNRGTRVKQGQTIGYVGTTGLSTGPHLHYEFILNGVHRNPRTILAKLPKAVSLEGDEVARFKRTIAPTLAQLDQLRNTQLAQRADN